MTRYGYSCGAVLQPGQHLLAVAVCSRVLVSPPPSKLTPALLPQPKFPPVMPIIHVGWLQDSCYSYTQTHARQLPARAMPLLLQLGLAMVPSAKGCLPSRSSDSCLHIPWDKSSDVLPTPVFPLQALVQDPETGLQRTPLSQHRATNFRPVPAVASCCQPLAWR